ncbi:MAG TPA: triose-phosphate isomerase [Thermomicrobiales bacterium]|nr:triose-phosphate isomerase [Thermomicrobiales bacterium]HRA32317.1 triose-phosphate isomerase [Thermomicrobiales bacterium]
MTRTKIVAGNWKMNTNLDEARALAVAIAGGAGAARGVDLAVFPPFPWIASVRDELGGSGVQVGAQNCYIQKSGAFTGEISPWSLVGVCQMILAGHSERRHVMGESDEFVGQKVDATLAAGLTSVLCVGELLGERQSGAALDVVTRQLGAGLAGVDTGHLDRLVIAYEPVWAIGTGVAATPDDAQEMCEAIRRWMTDRFDEAGDAIRVLYGGSVTPDNADELFRRPDVDGGLIGGASLKADAFLAIAVAAGAVGV